MKFTIEGKTIEVRAWMVAGIATAALAGIALWTSLYQIAPEQQGLVLRFGSYIRTVGPGLGMHLPFGIDRLYKVQTRIISVESFGERTHGRSGGYVPESSMLTGDLNMVMVGWDVQFSRENPTNFLFNVKEPINTLRDISQSVMREVMGDRASIAILTVGRSEVQRRVRQLVQKQSDQFGMGLRINEVNLLFVDPPPAVLGAFNDLNKAEQDAVRFFEEAAREYEERVPLARGEARRVVLEAEGFRERRINVARGEAQRFIDTLEAYTLAPAVTRRRFFIENMEKSLPHASAVIVVDPAIQSLLPHLNLREASKEIP